MKVSIITATLNSAETIECALNSLKNQDYEDIEHIIVDGKSKDNTLSLIKEIGFGYTKVVSETDTGLYDALNKGISLSTGEIVGFLHSDDFFSSTKAISKIVNCFKENNCHAVYGNLNYVSKFNVNKIIRHWESKKFDPSLLTRGWMPPHPTFFMKKVCYEKFGGYNPAYKISADYEAMIRYFSEEIFEAIYLPELISNMRVGGISNRSLKNIFIKMTEDLRIIRSHKLPLIRTFVGKNVSKLNQFF